MTEEKKYLTYEEAASLLGVGRSTLYAMTKDLGIKSYKFKYDKRRYLTVEDVERMKEVREHPPLEDATE